jgi:uncharacterized protein (TIGR02271 family)
MKKPYDRTVAIGVFDDRRRAQEAIQELKRNGFRDDEIGVVAKHDEDWPEELEHHEGSHAGTGAGAGAAAGLGLGGLWGLGIVAGALPAIGPAIAGGALASILTSAVAGAAAGGVVGGLIGLGIPKEEAEYYEEEFNRGRIIVSVKAGSRYDEARNILQRFGAYDIQSRHEGERTLTGQVTGDREGHMELREERLHAHPVETRTGEVDVRKEVVTERESIDVPVEREEIVVTRRAGSGKRASGKAIGEKEEVRIPVKEEHARVEKEVVSAGEVSVEKRKVRDTEHVSDDVKKERVKVEKRGDVNVRDRC